MTPCSHSSPSLFSVATVAQPTARRGRQPAVNDRVAYVEPRPYRNDFWRALLLVCRARRLERHIFTALTTL